MRPLLLVPLLVLAAPAAPDDRTEAQLREAVRLRPDDPDPIDALGGVLFKQGRVAESLAAFDRALALAPERRNGHWRRGIALYYAGRFEDGMRQFEGYQKVDTNDVENAAWHFLCAARKDGVAKARQGLLPIGKDRRVPMIEVYLLYKGDLKPEDVLKAAEAGEADAAERKGRLFYAHLYLGLFYEVSGDAAQAREHLVLAADRYRIAHYMGDVARVHVRLLDEKKEK